MQHVLKMQAIFLLLECIKLISGGVFYVAYANIGRLKVNISLCRTRWEGHVAHTREK